MSQSLPDDLSQVVTFGQNCTGSKVCKMYSLNSAAKRTFYRKSHRERERAPVVDVNECLGASFLISKLLSR